MLSERARRGLLSAPGHRHGHYARKARRRVGKRGNGRKKLGKSLDEFLQKRDERSSRLPPRRSQDRRQRMQWTYRQAVYQSQRGDAQRPSGAFPAAKRSDTKATSRRFRRENSSPLCFIVSLEWTSTIHRGTRSLYVLIGYKILKIATYLYHYHLNRTLADERSNYRVCTHQLFRPKSCPTDRPAFKQMMGCVREGDTVIVCSMDRLARNLSDLWNVTKELQTKGVSIKFLKESIHLDAPGGDVAISKLLMFMLGAVAELEHSMIHARQREGIEYRTCEKEGRL